MPTRYAGTAGEVRALNAVITLMRASNTLHDRFTARRAADGLTMPQFAVLETLLHAGPMCQSDLATKQLVSGPNMTKVIDVLERDGWVARSRGTGDRRYVTVALTLAGRRKIADVFPRHVADVVASFSALSGAEQEQLHRLCRKLGLGNVEIKMRKTTKGNT